MVTRHTPPPFEGKARRSRVQRPPPGTKVSREEQDLLLVRRLHAALCELPENQLILALLHGLADIEYKEIARLLGISVPDCYNRFARALKHIRERLGAPEPAST